MAIAGGNGGQYYFLPALCPPTPCGIRSVHIKVYLHLTHGWTQLAMYIFELGLSSRHYAEIVVH